MRFIGSKRLLLPNIENIIRDNIDNWDKLESFCDIFGGTGCVGLHFKKYFKIISNDLLFFSYIIQKSTIELNKNPLFSKLIDKDINDPLNYLNTEIPKLNSSIFIHDNFSPTKNSNRMYLTNENALKVDFFRTQINNWYLNKDINIEEYYYILSSIVQAVPFVSNIAGTYGAYLKNWDKRSFKTIRLEKPIIFDNGKKNSVYNKDSNKLINDISGDILYLDPPYNSRQYMPNYHLLETIAKYDSPLLKGITGIRQSNDDTKSKYCQKSSAADSLSELISKSKFKYIILSYSNEGIIPENTIDQILTSASKGLFIKNIIPYRRYKRTKDNIEVNLDELMYIIKK